MTGVWTYCEDLDNGARYVLKPGQYRAKNLRPEPGVFEMTDLVAAEQFRVAVKALREIAEEAEAAEEKGYELDRGWTRRRARKALVAVKEGQ